MQRSCTISKSKWDGFERYSEALPRGSSLKTTIMKSPILFFFLILVACFIITSCSSIHYSTRLIFWNVPSPKDHKKFPKNQIKKSVTPYHFTKGTKEQERQIYAQLAKSFHEEKYFNKNEADPTKKVDAYLKKMKTAAFLVITNDTLVFEKYYNKNNRESIQTSFSIAKSIISLLVGKAIEEGSIKSVDDAITDYLPELLECDAQFSQITIKDLLKMKSGISHSLIRDGLKAYYYPDIEKYVLQKLSLTNPLVKEWDYNNYNSVLLGLIIKRAANSTIANYFEKHIWSLIGTESDASWSTDKNGLELMGAGLNARAIDYMKIGKLVLDNGFWNNQALIEKEWLDKATQENSDDRRSYCYHWYKPLKRFTRDSSDDYFALGIWGQVMYISPTLNTTIIRFGKSKGNFAEEIEGGNWADRIIEFANYLDGVKLD